MLNCLGSLERDIGDLDEVTRVMSFPAVYVGMIHGGDHAGRVPWGKETEIVWITQKQ